MLDKTKALTDGLSTINGLVGERFGWDTNSRETTDLIRQLMKPMQLAIYDFTVVCETQMLKCDKAGAYLAGCMMGAAMNEALLSLLCLFYEESVKETRHYKTATQRETYEAMVGNWKFEHLIRIAAELKWIPNDVVKPELIACLKDVYIELTPIDYPHMKQGEIDKGAEEFDTNSGIALLRLIQELRNSIHSGKWIRGGRNLIPSNLDDWCRVSIYVSAEVRDCLIHLMVDKNVGLFQQRAAQLDEQVIKLKELFRSIGKGPDEVDDIIQRITIETIEQMKARSR